MRAAIFHRTVLLILTGQLLALIHAAPPVPPARTPPPLASLPHADQDAVMAFIAAQPKGVTFSSRNGRDYGMDSDAWIRLQGSDQVTVVEAGFAPVTYEGTYSVDPDGTIHVALRDYPAKWPDTYLYIGRTGALLHPTDGHSSLDMGGRGGATETGRMPPFWPFAAKLPPAPPLISRSYRPDLIYSASFAQQAGKDPVAEGATPEQRLFLTEYLRVMREEKEAIDRDRSYLFVEPLRRCGIQFPEGATVIWIATSSRLGVRHTAAGIRQIEKFMGLTPRR